MTGRCLFVGIVCAPATPLDLFPFAGEKGAIELFVAAERRIDPYPLEFSTLTWVSAGFRFVSR